MKILSAQLKPVAHAVAADHRPLTGDDLDPQVIQSEFTHQVSVTRGSGVSCRPMRFVPFILFLVGVIWLGLSGAPDERGFWPILLAALALGLAMAKDRRRYADAALAGAAKPIVMLMIFAWMLAGILAEMMQASGVVATLVGGAQTLGISGGGYTVAAFLICAVVSTSTGTSLGTLLLCTPLLYPAGADLGSAPMVLIGAILAGATFGDNVSPVSDTTIASASTQRAEMGRVVRTRLRYALPAAALSLLLFGLFGGSGAEASVATAAPNLNAAWMLLAPAAVIVLLLAGRHLLEGLFAGITLAMLIGTVTGSVPLAQLFYLDLEQFGARGLIVDGVERAVGVSVFTLLLMALVGGVEEGGGLTRLIERSAKRVRGRRSAELWIFAVTSLCVLVTTHAVVAILTVGDWVRRVGGKAEVSDTRRANLLDLTVSTYPFLLPWFIPTILAAALTVDTAAGMPRIGPAQVGLWNVHSWALLAITLLVIATGWGGRAERA